MIWFFIYLIGVVAVYALFVIETHLFWGFRWKNFLVPSFDLHLLFYSWVSFIIALGILVRYYWEREKDV